MDLRIAVFVTASTLAHGGAALWFDTDQPPQLNVGGEARALRVALLPAAQVAAHSTVKTHNTQTLTPASKPTPARVNQRKVVTAKPPVAEPQAASVTRQPASNRNPATSRHSSAEHISESISAALRNQLARHFEYPWLARQRGWQGRVLLSLRVASNGSLSEWKIVQTSGYRTLDQSALKAARRIEHLPQAEHWLKSGSLEVRLPVQYKLLDS